MPTATLRRVPSGGAAPYVTNMVGQITSALASGNHNIANMINKSRGSFAYTLIDLDDEPSGACAESIGKIEGVLRVRKL